MFFVIISISIYNFGIYLILVLSICNAIQSADCHVRYFNKLSIDQRGTNDTKYCRTSSSLKRPLFHAFLDPLLTGRVRNIHSSLLNLFHTERQRWHAVACKRSPIFGRRSG